MTKSILYPKWIRIMFDTSYKYIYLKWKIKIPKIRPFIIWYIAKSDKKAQKCLFNLNLRKYGFHKRRKNYVKWIYSIMSFFGIYFCIFYGNHTFQNLGLKDYYFFLQIFALAILYYKWPNFCYLKFLFQMNVFIGCI